MFFTAFGETCGESGKRGGNMIERESFFREFNGHANSYSRFLVLNKTAEEVIKVLNDIDSDMTVGSGNEENGAVYFEICKELPDVIYKITKALNTTGYADIDWNATYTVCAKNGDDFDGYTADWLQGMHYYRDEDGLWDAFVDITDKETGVVFHTGAGAVDREIEQYYADMVKSHR